MTYKEFKNLDYPDEYSIEYVLRDLMFKKKLDFVTIAILYSKALEQQNTILDSEFTEASTCIYQLLSGNYIGKDKEEVIKRAIHIYNLNRKLFKDVLNKQYNYTESDLAKWDNFCEITYGIKL